MNAEVDLLLPLGLLFLTHVRFMLVVNKVDDRSQRVAIVDVVTETRSVDDSELGLELLLLKLGLDDVYFGQLVQLLVVTASVVLWRRELSGEKRVDKRGLSQARLA